MKKMFNLPGNAIVGVLYVVGFGAFLIIGMLVARRRAPNQPLWAWETEMERVTPTQPLPSVVPAQTLDASDTTPWTGINAPSYCPSCWVIWNNGTMIYATPAGEPVFCFEHKYTPLHRAYVERAFIQEAAK